MGSRIGSHFFIPSFKSLLGPRFGIQIWTQKWGQPSENFAAARREVLQADLRRTSMSVSVNTCFFSLCVPLCFLYSRGPFLAAMCLLVFWILFWGPWWSRFVGIRGAPRLTEACPRHAWQELLWKKPPLRTSTCGRHRFRRNHPLWEPKMWQGQVWEARPDGESTRGKAKFGKRHGSRKWEEENSSTRRRHRGKGRKRLKTPSPPYNVPHTPLGIRTAGCFLLLCISQTPEMHPRPFVWGFLASAVVLRKGSLASAGASAGIRACVGRYVNQNGCFSGPCLVTLLPRLIEIARACNHSSWFKFSSSQYPLEN